MRTTIDLPDDLFRKAKARAELNGMKLKDLITSYVEQGLRQGGQSPSVPRRRRSELLQDLRLAQKILRARL